MGSNNIFNSFHRTNYIKKIELSKISKIIINYLRDPKKEYATATATIYKL